MTKIFDWKEKINESELDEISSAIKEGKLVIFPTETVYGIGASIYNDDALKNQLITQIKTGVFQNINFSKLYNDCRYPSYNLYKNRYFVLHISREDCERISQISQQLTRFIHDFDRI